MQSSTLDFSQLYFDKLKEHKGLSQETMAFEGVLMFDGKKLADVSNDGGGGCHREYWEDRKLQLEFHKWAQTLEDYTEDGPPLPMSGDFFLTLLAGATLDAKTVEAGIKRRCKRNILVSRKGDPFGAFIEINAPFTPENRAYVVKQLADRFGFFYNEKTDWPKKIHYPCKIKSDAKEKPISEALSQS